MTIDQAVRAIERGETLHISLKALEAFLASVKDNLDFCIEIRGSIASISKEQPKE